MKKGLLIVFFIIFLYFLQLNCDFSVNDIKNSNILYYGEGEGFSKEEAKREARNNLAEKISTIIQKEFSYKDDDKKLIIKTISVAELYFPEYIECNSNNNYPYAFLCYIKRALIDSVIVNRKRKIQTLCQQGLDYEKNSRYIDALNNYYSAYTLIKTLPPFDNNVKFNWNNNNDLDSFTVLETKISDILNEIHFSIDEINRGETYTDLHITTKHNSSPINYINISYFNGYHYVDAARWENGIGKIRINNLVIDIYKAIKLKINFKSNYDSKEIELSLDFFINEFFIESIKILNL